MGLQIIALVTLTAAIVLGFVKKINVGIVSLGLSLALGLVGGVKANVIFAGFPGKLFITLLGTMFLFCLLQENKTLELLSKKMVVLVGKHTYLIPDVYKRQGMSSGTGTVLCLLITDKAFTIDRP